MNFKRRDAINRVSALHSDKEFVRFIPSFCYKKLGKQNAANALITTLLGFQTLTELKITDSTTEAGIL
ncbi:MAG: hypothetical protein LBV75_03375, partial [Paludibacter sp.]|nr:hypothetical protein [Paludibacter sp.]